MKHLLSRISPKWPVRALLAGGMLTWAGVASSPAMAADTGSLTLDRTVRQDGTSDLKVEAVLPTRWESRFGMDLGVPGDRARDPYAKVIVPWQQRGEASSVAWGRVGIPGPGGMGPGGVLGWDRTTIDARIDPIAEEGRIAGTVVRRWALGDALSASLQGSVTMVETGLGTAAGARHWETARAARVDIGPTGTALIARGEYSQLDPVWHGSLTAEQSVGRGLHVSTTLNEIESGEPVLRVGAGFTRRW